jgi:hypothetical protein
MPTLDGLEITGRDRLETKAATLLAEYRTIDAHIAVFRRRAKGDDLPTMPSAGARSLRPDEDEVDIVEALRTIEYTVTEEDLIACLRRYVSTASLQSALAPRSIMGRHVWYASVHRLRSLLEGVNGQTRDDLELLAGVKAMLDERIQAQGESVKLTQTEALAQARWAEIERAREIVEVLEYNRVLIEEGLSLVRVENEEWHHLLWLQYVQGHSVAVVCSEMRLTVDMHRAMREHAMTRFLYRCPVESLVTGIVDGWERKKRGRK